MIGAFYADLFSDPHFVQHFNAWCAVWRVLAICAWLHSLLFGRRWWNNW